MKPKLQIVNDKYLEEISKQRKITLFIQDTKPSVCPNFEMKPEFNEEVYTQISRIFSDGICAIEINLDTNEIRVLEVKE